MVEGGCFETRKKFTILHHVTLQKTFFLNNGLLWRGRLMADLSPRTHSFNPRPVRAGVMVNKVALGWFFLS